MRGKRIKAAVLGALLVAGLSTVPAGAASAGSTLCPSAKVCIYVDPGFVGLLGYRSGGLGLANVSSGADNKTSSWENKSSYNAAWYDQRDGGGNCFNMLSKREVSSIGWPSYDKLSSWRTNRGC